jgi:porin
VIAGGSSFAHAEEAAPASPLVLALDYQLDLMDVTKGGVRKGAEHLDALTLSADLDLERAIGWRGASAHVDLLNTSGGAANDRAGTLQGVDSIEVGAQRGQVYQAWIQQNFAADRGSLLVGLYDVSGEFGVLDSTGYFIGAGFGMAPDLAGSGRNGVAAYPATALAARLSWAPTEATYVQAAVVNARPGAPGLEPDLDTSFDDGVLLIAEAGWTGKGKIALGGWTHTRRADDQRETDAAGAPLQRRAQGIYVIGEQPLGERTTAFAKVSVSDGDSQPVKASWQAGVQLQPVLASRPNSTLVFGVSQVRLADGYRANAADAGQDLDRAETVVELAWSDQLTDKVRIQPDLQYVRRPGGDRGLKDAVIAGVRIQVAF